MPPVVAAAIIGGVASVGGAVIASREADKAARLQTQGASEALDFTRGEATRDQKNFEATQKANYDQYIAQQARNRPYQQLGASAAGTLQRRLGLPDVQLPANPAPPVYQGMESGSAMPTGPRPTITQLGNTQAGTTVGDMAGSKVWMRAPTGETAQVPEAQVPFWLQKGATRITMGGTA